MKFDIKETEGKTKIIFNNNKEKFYLMILCWISFILLLCAITMSIFKIYLITIFFLFCIISLFGFIVIYYYSFNVLKDNIIIIDAINQRVLIDDIITHEFRPNTKIIQYYQIKKDSYVYGQLVFEVDGQRNIGGFRKGELNYIFGKKLQELLHIPYNLEQRNKYIRNPINVNFFLSWIIGILIIFFVFLPFID